jgi:hypothetical protein
MSQQKKQTKTETVLTVNPNSCGGSTGKNWENLYDQIKKIFGENPEVAFSQKSGDGTTLKHAKLSILSWFLGYHHLTKNNTTLDSIF